MAAKVGPLPVHFVGKAGTFALLYALPLLLLAEVAGPVGAAGRRLGWAFARWGIVLYWLAGALYLRQAVDSAARKADVVKRESQRRSTRAVDGRWG